MEATNMERDLDCFWKTIFKVESDRYPNLGSIFGNEKHDL